MGPLATPALSGVVVAAWHVTPPPAPKSPPEEKVETVALGGPDYYIQAVLTTRGGGVQSLTLSKFQEADRGGRPVFTTGPNNERVPAPLQLIPPDPYRPSFTLYHYADPGKAGDEPPVATLGERVWTLEKRIDSGDEQQVRFSTTVPGFDHLTVTRIYSLKKNDYHIGLTLEIKDDRDPQGKGAERSFRYQLAGPHGIPIEGEWYTSIYRNAVIGMVDSTKNVWRTLEDSRRISHRDGGERVPPAGRGTDFLQYAVVVNQFFASGIVVDDRQPPEAEGGVDKRNILAWARPTAETREARGRLKLIDLAGGRVVLIPIGESGRTTTYELLPRARAQVVRLGLRENDEVMLNVYEAQGRRIVEAVNRGSGSRPFLNDITVRVNSELIDLKPGETRVHKFLLYQGPVKVSLLGYFRGDESVDPDLVDRYADTLHLRTLTDYHSDNWLSTYVFSRIGLTRLFIFCTNLMHWLLHMLLLLVRVEGLSIIFLTVLVRGVMFPISRRQALMSQKM
jgi:hypothetical protein